MLFNRLVRVKLRWEETKLEGDGKRLEVGGNGWVLGPGRVFVPSKLAPRFQELTQKARGRNLFRAWPTLPGFRHRPER